MPRGAWWLGVFALVVGVAVFAGCIGTEEAEPSSTSDPAVANNSPAVEAPDRAVVVDIGPGTNPYHEAFRRPGWSAPPDAVIDGMPEPTRLNLTLGESYESSRSADEDVWSNYENETLYWVPGTNLLLYTNRPMDWKPDGQRTTFHGAGTTDAVQKVCRDCYVVAYQDTSSIDGEPTEHIANEWSWVDLVTSTNTPGGYGKAQREGSYANATYELYKSGRLQFVASGNNGVAGVPFPHYSLAPWAVTIGGAHSNCNAVEAGAGKPNDFVGNFTQRLAAPHSIERTQILSGTSFSTPQLAGAYAKALVEIRRSLPEDTGEPKTLWSGPAQSGPYLEDGNLTHVELLDAFNHTARYFEPSAYQPCEYGGLATAVPASPTPWVEMGWGYVGPQEAEFAADVVLGEAKAPSISPGAEAWMKAQHEARQVPYDTVWDDVDE